MLLNCNIQIINVYLFDCFDCYVVYVCIYAEGIYKKLAKTQLLFGKISHIG